MKFLFSGGNGMTGHMISLFLKGQMHNVHGVALPKSSLVDFVIGNARDASLIKNLIGIDKFDALINCIGLLNQACKEHKPRLCT